MHRPAVASSTAGGLPSVRAGSSVAEDPDNAQGKLLRRGSLASITSQKSKLTDEGDVYAVLEAQPANNMEFVATLHKVDPFDHSCTTGCCNSLLWTIACCCSARAPQTHLENGGCDAGGEAHQEDQLEAHILRPVGPGSRGF